VKEILHEDFNTKDNKENDFMIVKLARDSSKPIVSLNKDPDVPEAYQPATVIGLGRLGENKGSPGVLQEVLVADVPYSECADMFDRGWIDEKTMICAAANGKDACMGDSGGPLLVDSSDPFDSFLQIGKCQWLMFLVGKCGFKRLK